MAMDPASPGAKSPHSSPDSFPTSPALSDIAASILSELDPRKLYPGKDLVQETKQELKKIFYQGPGGDAMSMKTPGTATKAAADLVHNLKGSLSSEPVSRTNMDHSQAQAPSSVNLGGQLIRNILKNCDKPSGYTSSSNAEGIYQGHSHHLQGSLVDRRPIMAPSIPQPKPMSSLEIKALTDGRAFLSLSERLMSSQEDSERQRTQEITDKELPSRSALELFAPKEHAEPISFGLDGRHQQPHEQMEVDCRPKVLQGAYTHSMHNPQRAVAELVHPPTHIPRSHDDYYSLRNQDDTFHNLFHSDKAQSDDNMDILEYIDHSSMNQPSTSHMHGHHHAMAVVPMATDSLYPQEASDRQLLRGGREPAPVRSPEWLSWLPPKPPIGSPSPPQMLFPRRLY